ncbi:MAG: Smr/MutS family protein [Pseudomonadota bacterium]
MRRPRHLSPEERALWDRVADRTTPLHPDRPLPDPAATPAPKPARKPDVPAPLPEFRVGQQADGKRANDLLRPLAERLSNAPVQMDNKAFGKMKRGKIKPEARIDLHGMTLAEAHPELIAFILGAQAVGRRLVLVITGKGKNRDDGGPIPTRFGVLRHQVPQWLAQPPLRQAILQVTPAHLRHGGEGAYYVYLRRTR